MCAAILLGAIVDAVAFRLVVDDCGAPGTHRVMHIQYSGQNLVLDLDQPRCLGRDLGVSAATAATASPTNRTFLSRYVHVIGRRFGPGLSGTGVGNARNVFMRDDVVHSGKACERGSYRCSRIRACACGLLTSFAWSSPRISMSSVNVPRPVASLTRVDLVARACRQPTVQSSSAPLMSPRCIEHCFDRFLIAGAAAEVADEYMPHVMPRLDSGFRSR